MPADFEKFMQGFGKWRGEYWEPGPEWQVQAVVRSRWFKNPVVDPFVGVLGRVAALQKSCWPDEILIILDYGELYPNNLWSYFSTYAHHNPELTPQRGRLDYAEPCDLATWRELMTALYTGERERGNEHDQTS